MKQWSAQTVARYKPVLFAAGLFPLARWIWLGWHDALTANPIEFLTRSSGTWALVCLLVTLAITPLRRILHQPALVRLRRACGLFAFFYALLHVIAWVWWDRGLDISAMIQDVWERPFITAGFVAFICMTALALTSTQGAMRRLGKRWQTLHRLIYLLGVLAIVHLWWHKAGKNDFEQPLIYGAVLALLLGWRLVARFK
ncbi:MULTISPECIES: protein-methionine-sulfoxide reductase heme-binding subunit MsrQ [unclassified Bordetella]|uniref:protein-methionine-sulfoxide reductase heme-binding subunit MsrQ n=1 Tax=unclassified Bordetella TaxID=2630031 RepID=UPI0013206F03|nr:MULTISPECIES: protein-methionine-sulfoxide reductase heme-binding subunit MsrQ [unclassified Bordetella]MVW71912.1 protein-methionine-sulfoxide reductase heme-binding subunit MsrQ [Bordetella sp. 15P40C-2]MVW77901.1 protein-methionine-sulfoxide reductase heme-binding subunit MsrQ [Bordetella sp. 02P26C-1]